MLLVFTIIYADPTGVKNALFPAVVAKLTVKMSKNPMKKAKNKDLRRNLSGTPVVFYTTERDKNMPTAHEA
ncbi:MAG: hypothetical protein ACF8OB_19610 [Phycisphaeraceae bacterium JB051]